MTNKDFYERSKNFCGDIEAWFSNCVKDTDLFRVWFKDHEDEECNYYYFVNMIKVGDRYLVGLVNYGCEPGKESIWYDYVDEMKFELVTNEEDCD